MVLLIDPDQKGLLVVVPEENQLKEVNKELSRDPRLDLVGNWT